MFDQQLTALHEQAMKLRGLIDTLLARSAEDVDFSTSTRVSND